MITFFEFIEDKKANARFKRTRGTPNEQGYGNALILKCNRCKAEVLHIDYGNPTGYRYSMIYAKEAGLGHYELCIRG